MKHLLVSALVLLPSIAVAQDESAPAGDATAPAPAADSGSGEHYAAWGEGRTLPENVMRARLPFRFVTTDQSYDKDGKKVDEVVNASVTAGAFVLEYGLTDRLSLQAKMDYYYSQEAKFKSDDEIVKTKTYKDLYDANVVPAIAKSQSDAINLLAANYVAQGVPGCTSIDACKTALANGLALPAEQDLTGTALKMKIPANAPIKAYVEAAIATVGAATGKQQILDGIKAAGKDAKTYAKGQTGIGDTEVGALYAVFTKDESPVAFSLGGGFRFPTGNAELKAGELPRTKYTTSMGIRANLDYEVVSGLFLCFQHQVEFMLAKGKMKAGGSDVDYATEGVRNLGFLRASWGLGNISQAVSILGLYGAYNYDKDAKIKVGTAPAADAAQMTSMTGGLLIDGLAHQIPLQLELEHEMPISGKNTKVLTKNGVTLRAFYKF